MESPHRTGLALFLGTVLSLACSAQERESSYVAMRDGTALAVDVLLPRGDEPAAPRPALIELTRYWRSMVEPSSGRPVGRLSPLDRALLDAGYALVKVDTRGSGASFGVRRAEYSRQEVRDGYDVVEWVVAQPWCDGSVGAYGTSYSGTTAELLAACGHPAVGAVIPGWSDFDVYSCPARPYGAMTSVIGAWGELVARLDANDPTLWGVTVRPVDGDEDGAALKAAVEEHADNVDVAAGVRAAPYRDDPLHPEGDTFEEVSSMHWRDAIEQAGTPMLVLASWLDAGTADGALRRFTTFSNPQKLVILASNHGGAFHASPFAVDEAPLPPEPSAAEQIALRIRFFDHFLRGAENGVADWPAVRWFHLGEEAFREADAWPPAGVRARRLYLGAGGELTDTAEEAGEGRDAYDVDFGVTTGRFTRWTTQLGGAVNGLSDRGAMDARMLVYDSPPLERPLDVTGTPTVTLHLTSSVPDALVLVYLEDVAPDGRSRYVTEGGLRLVHRALAPSPYGGPELPYHTFRREDARPAEPGEPLELVFQLLPTSVRFAAGHRVRVALAGADADNLERVPADGDVRFELLRSPARPSFVELPAVGAP